MAVIYHNVDLTGIQHHDVSVSSVMYHDVEVFLGGKRPSIPLSDEDIIVTGGQSRTPGPWPNGYDYVNPCPIISAQKEIIFDYPDDLDAIEFDYSLIGSVDSGFARGSVSFVGGPNKVWGWSFDSAHGQPWYEPGYGVGVGDITHVNVLTDAVWTDKGFHFRIDREMLEKQPDGKCKLTINLVYENFHAYRWYYTQYKVTLKNVEAIKIARNTHQYIFENFAAEGEPYAYSMRVTEQNVSKTYVKSDTVETVVNIMNDVNQVFGKIRVKRIVINGTWAWQLLAEEQVVLNGRIYQPGEEITSWLYNRRSGNNRLILRER